jgi:hypothetical protein
MSLFNELSLKTITHDDELYLNVKDLSYHIVNALYGFALESKQLGAVRAYSSEESAFLMGIGEGMNSIALMLSQGGVEEEFHRNINTVEDLLNTLGDK